MNGIQPYLPIHPKSYRKHWQYDDEAYNYIFDFLVAFTEFNFDEELQQALNTSRIQVAKHFSAEELFKFLWQSTKESTFRRLQTPEIEENFKKRISGWNMENTKRKLLDEEEKEL